LKESIKNASIHFPARYLGLEVEDDTTVSINVQKLIEQADDEEVESFDKIYLAIPKEFTCYGK
jgi:hypothetical protein